MRRATLHLDRKIFRLAPLNPAQQCGCSCFKAKTKLSMSTSVKGARRARASAAGRAFRGPNDIVVQVVHVGAARAALLSPAGKEPRKPAASGEQKQEAGQPAVDSALQKLFDPSQEQQTERTPVIEARHRPLVRTVSVAAVGVWIMNAIETQHKPQDAYFSGGGIQFARG
jgi:hypothetical protein